MSWHQVYQIKLKNVDQWSTRILPTPTTKFERPIWTTGVSLIFDLLTWKWHTTHHVLMGLFVPCMNIIHDEIGNEPSSGHSMQDWQMDGRTVCNQYTPHNFGVQGAGYNYGWFKHRVQHLFTHILCDVYINTEPRGSVFHTHVPI